MNYPANDMDDNLVKLLKNDVYLNESELIKIFNNRYLRLSTANLNDFSKEIDEATKFVHKKIENESSTKTISSFIEKLESHIIHLETVNETGKVVTDKSEGLIEKFQKDIDDINQLENQYKSLEKQETLLEIISSIQSSLILDDIQLASDNLICLISALQINDTNPVDNQKSKLIIDQFKKYYHLVDEELKKQFKECIKEISWPYVSENLQIRNLESNIEQIQSISEKFSWTFRQLYLIDIPDFMISGNTECTKIINTNFMDGLDKISLPVELLLEPLVKYFKLFFWTNNKINKISKPEWYMAQIIQWITVHHSILGEVFNDSVLELDVRLEFIRGLVIMAMEKVQKDFDIILKKSNDDLFFHLIEEALTMTVDLRKHFDYPRSYPDPIDVICNSNEIFDNWMKLEQRYASRNLDEVFLSSNSWQGLSKICKRVECLNSFIGLISAMKDRIHCVFDISRQKRFSEVLLEVLDDFRRRLLQISKAYSANSQRWYDIMNVIYNVKMLLRNWRLDQMFIEIYEHRKISKSSFQDPEEVLINDSSTINSKQFKMDSLYSKRTKTIENFKLSENSLFSNVLSLYQHVLEEMEEQCIESSFDEVSERADSYINTSWLDIDSQITPRLMSLSPSASGMLLVLRDRLFSLESSLEDELFEYIWQELAVKLNDLLFNDVIRSHKFNELGASQLEFDIRKNLLPLFLPYTKTPERFFVKCLEACTLLNLKRGTSLLIKQILVETLHSDDHRNIFTRSRLECPIRTLTEIGVLSLTPEESEFILNLRIDINMK